MLRVLGSRGASAGKLSANSDEISRVGEEALGGRVGADRALACPAPPSGHEPEDQYHAANLVADLYRSEFDESFEAMVGQADS